MIYIFPYKLGSASAQALRKGLSSILGYHVKLVKPDGKFNPRRKDRVINWGCSLNPVWEFNTEKDINDTDAVRSASNKLHAFQLFKEYEVPTPEWTQDINEAKTWFTKKDTTVLCRTILNGHSGHGIVLATSNDDLVPAPLYVKYKKKKEEYRVHVVNGKVIDTQQKRKRDGFRENPKFNPKIRNHDNGWIYARDMIRDDQQRDAVAIKAVAALGLNFGAVDIIYNELDNMYYVLEVNTAPGIEGTTLNKYVEAFVNV